LGSSARPRPDMSCGGAGLVSYSDSSGEEGGEGNGEEEEEDIEERKSPPRKKQCRDGKQKQVEKCFLLYNFVPKLMIHVVTVMIMGLYKARGWSLGSKVIPHSFLLCSSLAITMATPHSALPLPTAILDMFNEEGNFLLPLTCWVEELKGLYTAISCTIKPHHMEARLWKTISMYHVEKENLVSVVKTTKTMVTVRETLVLARRAPLLLHV